ncbi:phage major capsid protein [Paratractidigestivibacter sp.]|uniref:phage major capsid protein n=1 Tax=Paratractidigestivibacter sp. TaxID=2847316 RepID=UPI004026F08B
MALTTKKIVLPKDVAVGIVNKASDTSTIAALSPSTPMLFRDQEYMVFNPTAEAEVVEEGAQKGSYEASTSTVTAKRVKLQTTTRVTSELEWADEDNRTQIIESIVADQAAAFARALDYVVYHAINPKSGEALGEGYTALSGTATQVTSTGDAVEDIDAIVDAIAATYDVNGIALSKTFAASLRKVRVPSTGLRLYPEIPLNLKPGTVEGVAAATSGTVSGALAKTATNVLAFAGDFSVIKWGLVRDMTAQVIPYGDPDGAGDLQRTNQIAYRTEGIYGYAVLDPKALACLKAKVGK